MKPSTLLVLAALITGVFAVPLITSAADKKAEKKVIAVKPYPLTTCIVAGDKLDDEPCVFEYQGRQIKLCCNGCKKDFDKEPAKFIKQLEEAEKNLKK